MSPSFNPRTVKEADALAEAGHDVRVVSVRSAPENDDLRLVSGRKWRFQSVSYSQREVAGFARWIMSGIRSKTSRLLATLSASQKIAEAAFCRYSRGQMGLVLSEPADLYIAHNLQNLPVAARAAELNGGRFGFDMEDYHVDEDAPLTRDPIIQRFKEQILGLYLPQCAYLSVTSEAMADAVELRFGIARPLVLYNAFPLANADGIPMPEPATSVGDYYTAYWFSQVVGLDRGLQDFIRALPALSHPVQLHIRGRASDPVKKHLFGLAKSLGVERQIIFHDTIYSEDLVRDASLYDFGLALEQPINDNKRLTASNKLFTYLLAGIIPVATATPGQLEVMEQVGPCGVVFEPGDFDTLVAGMNALLASPSNVLNARLTAWHAARASFCWDLEKRKLVSAIGEFSRCRNSEPREWPSFNGQARPVRTQQFDLPVLMYHDIQLDDAPGAASNFSLPLSSFVQQLEFLKHHGYETITVSRLLEDIRRGRGHQPNQIVLTFDDGYESFAQLVMPLLSERGMTATSFIVVSQIGGFNVWDANSGAAPRRPLMNEHDIRAAIEGGFEIGIHGWAHRDLTQCTRKEMDEEIFQSRSYVQQRFGISADTFAYPFGKYSAVHFDLLEAAGYSGAVSIFSGENYVTSNRFAMRRIYIHSGDSLSRFRLKMTPLYLRYKAARRTPLDGCASRAGLAAKGHKAGTR